MTKLKREPIVIDHSVNESTIDFPKLEITIEKKTYDLNKLSNLENIHEIVMALKIYLKGQRAARSIFLELRNFLTNFLKISEKIDEKSMIKYKNFLDANVENSLSTKYQKFSIASAFIKGLIRDDIIPDFPIPPNFYNINKEQKKSFGEIARYFIDNDSNFEHQDIRNIIDQFELEYLQAKTLSYSLRAIDIIHKKAIADIYKWEDDWKKLEEIIEQLSKEDLEKLKFTSDFTKDFFIRERTLEEAFQILYSIFGGNIPAVKYWPKGMEDFFRSKGWKSSRVKKLLEGTSTNINDVDVFNKAIKNLSLNQKEKFNKIENFYINSDQRDSRSIELALSILYAKYGRILPNSKKWPNGICDYLKYRNWKPSRVRAAFFPTPETLAPFIIGLLSHIEIAPNVDSVAFYTYLTSFKPSSKEGKINVVMDKFRANRPIQKDIISTDPMISLCVKHSKRMLLVLKNLDNCETKDFFQRKTPLFLQCNNKSVRRDIHTLDSSTVVNIVKRFLADLAEEEPFILPLVQGGCTGQNFRPTIALIQKLCGESTIAIQKLLNHSHSSTTQIYTERVLTQSMIFNKSKKFQNYLVENASRNHSYNKDQQLLNTGVEDAVDEWISCDAKRIWFKDNDVIANWIAWEKIISDSENELKFENPIRWEKYWLPRLIKYQSLLENILEKDKKFAKTLAETIKLPPLS
ncbi:MAG: hypothetical protein GAK29_04931 [Acinetobacter bereziniae]|uniref:Uncharacterized protein n=1 Tax=Acinetobacter bereziniae TaxID=106648 RepID=A0A833PAD9_ACIBZ|nr:MAG: hypothetical protein GAK29_04931 [Acinetobacter bereziniae]